MRIREKKQDNRGYMRMRTEQTDRQREGADRLGKLENTGGMRLRLMRGDAVQVWMGSRPREELR